MFNLNHIFSRHVQDSELLFAVCWQLNVGLFADNVGLTHILFAFYLGSKSACLGVELLVFARRYTYRTFVGENALPGFVFDLGHTP